jgi:hypothetical protein
VREWWHQFDWPLSVAEGPPGLFNRSAARNQAAARAGDWDVAVFGDADTVGEPDLVRKAVLSASDGWLAYPFTEFLGLSRGGTISLLQGGLDLAVTKRMSGSPGGILAVPRDLFDEVGGFDEMFTGWGYEDLAFAYAAGTLGGVHREDGMITHLWHPNAGEKRDAIAGKSGNRRRSELYRAANGDPVMMRILLESLKEL